MIVDIQSESALIVAHPGHELMIHGWLEAARPSVFVLTDGSGRSATSRLASTEKILESAGSRRSSFFGPMTDQEVYRSILDKETDLFLRMIDDLARQLEQTGVRQVVGDATEYHNPVHDLCRLLVNLTTQRLAASHGVHLRNYQFSLYGPHNEACAKRNGSIHIALDDSGLRRKLETAAAYKELSPEISLGVSFYGPESFRTECLEPVLDSEPCFPRSQPSYENYGEQQVRAGFYHRVLRYEDHFRPFAEELTRRATASS